MKFTIIIPTRNRKDFLKRCLAAALSQDYSDYEVIVIDNGSSDGTDEMIRDAFPKVRYFLQDKVPGPAATRNLGIRKALGEIIAFTDDDCIVPPNWLQLQLKYYDDQQIAAVGGSQNSHQPNFYDKLQMAHYADELQGLQRVERVSGWEGLITANMSVRREIFDRVGLFDESFITGADPEFIGRVSRAGYAFIRDPDIPVEHYKVYTLRSFLKMRFQRGCGSVLADIKLNSLSARRFVPIMNVVRVARDWRNYRRLFGGGVTTFLRFWGLNIIIRWIDVSGRVYYYWTIGRSYKTALRLQP